MASRPRLDKVIEEYLNVFKVRGSETSIPNMRTCLGGLLTAVGNVYPHSLKAKHMEMWLLEHQNWQPSTRRVNVARMAAFIKWMHRRGYVKDPDLLEGYGNIKVPKKQKVFIPARDFARVLDIAGQYSPRDRFVVALGLFLMVRVSEMTALRWRDVDEKISVYRRKTQTADELPISRRGLLPEINRWRREFCKAMGVAAVDPDWYVVCPIDRGRKRGEGGRYVRMEEQQFRPTDPFLVPRHRVKDILAEAGYSGPGVGMHTLRRSGAQALLEALLASGEGQDFALMTVQEMLGHADVSTTMVYLNWSANRNKRDMLVESIDVMPAAMGGDVVELRTG